MKLLIEKPTIPEQTIAKIASAAQPPALFAF
jgi:hypothetical protein